MYSGVMDFCYSTKVGSIARMMAVLDIWLRGVGVDIIVVESEVIRILFVLDDHVMEYNACLHYHTQLTFVHVSSWTANDSEPGL